MSKKDVVAGRVSIGILMALALMTQFIVIPQTASSYASRYPEVAHLEMPYAVATIFAIVVFELALVSAWKSISAIARDASGRRWINASTAALCSMLLIVAGICVHAVAIANVGGPLMLFGLVLSCALGIAALALRPRVLQVLDDQRGSSTSGSDESTSPARSGTDDPPLTVVHSGSRPSSQFLSRRW